MPFDLIISDVMMPEMDGFELLAKLKAHPQLKFIPLILLTARAEGRDKLTALRMGVDDYLLKPFDQEELMARIENLISNSRNRMEEPSSGALRVKSSGTEGNQTKELLHEGVWMQSVEKCILLNISDPEFYLEDLCRALSISRSTLYRKLKAYSGIPPGQLITEIRMRHARHLLESRQVHSLQELGDAIGVKDVFYFARSFRKRFGKDIADFFSR